MITIPFAVVLLLVVLSVALGYAVAMLVQALRQ